MEQCAKGFGAIGQILPDPVSTTSMNWHISPSSVEWSEVICPQPVRASRNPYLTDSGSRLFYCKPKSLNVHNRQSEMDVLDFILNLDDQDGDYDLNRASSFCGSPPVRSSNPVIRDAAFGKLSSPVPSPLGGSYGGMHSPRLERVGNPCGSSTFSSKPKIRIEGFASGNSDSRCVVSALA